MSGKSIDRVGGSRGVAFFDDEGNLCWSEEDTTLF